MLAQAAKPIVRLVDSYLPDPYIFVLILTLIVIVAALAIEGHGPIAVIRMWGDGFWGLLAFSMQMLLVLVTGFMLASTPPVKRVLVGIARSVGSPGAAIVTVSLVSLVAHWINWGFGLIASALLARPHVVVGPSRHVGVGNACLANDPYIERPDGELEVDRSRERR